MLSIKAILELNGIVKELKNFLSNNYKDAAHEQRKLLGEKAEAYYRAGKLTRRHYLHYQRLYTDFTRQMKDYHH